MPNKKHLISVALALTAMAAVIKIAEKFTTPSEVEAASAKAVAISNDTNPGHYVIKQENEVIEIYE